ncbi:hypothetical protein RJ639_030901 [Escallonia herrerae]|uniref:Retrovirus-related Pol polyprotein from transposon TNT 1-94 n=1 Tax=Escallonia herrerae TaxID=1293975 RepID=A0AA88WZ22_9ASTE|nr:hypothetical protein RJ639_030901 [Escallonia herrerae]
MAEEGKGKIDKFNGMNFQWWKMQVEDYLYQKDLYLPLVEEKPEAMNASEWAILDRKAFATNNKQKNRGRSSTRGRSRGKLKSKGKTIVCWNCNKEGHKKNDCTEPKKKKGAGGRQGDDEGTNMKWKALVENETGNNIKWQKIDNGGEYCDGGFQEYCSNNGIRLIRTVKRTPQENGLAEMMNITIMERARCMRIHADLPLQFWATTMDTAIYLINKSPANALNGGILEEEWSGGTAVSWISKLQKIVALSTTEAEYVTVTEASREIIRLQRLLIKLGYGQLDCNLWTDSQSAIHLAKNSAFHSRTKHIQLRYHFIRSLLEDEQLNLEKIEGIKNPADMLTKYDTMELGRQEYSESLE